MTQETFSVRSHHGSKSTVERAAEAIFTACGFFCCSGCCFHYIIYDIQRYTGAV